MVRPYTRKFGVTFPVAVDTADVFGQAFDLKAIPVTYLVDELGIIRLQGGAPTPRLLQKVEAILAEPRLAVDSSPPTLLAARSPEELIAAAAEDPQDGRLRLALGQRYAAEGKPEAALEELKAAAQLLPQDPGVYFAWGLALLESGQREAGLTKLRQARDLDPSNWRIRKQIWAIEHPEKFYTQESPDFRWQKEELAREKNSDKPVP